MINESIYILNPIKIYAVLIGCILTFFYKIFKF